MSKCPTLMCALLCLGAVLPATQQRACGAEWGEPSAAEKRIAEALKSPTEMKFIETPLKDVLATIGHFHKIEVQIDQRALDDVGVPADTPITKDIKGISLRSALRLMLRDLNLTYVIENEVLLITTPEAAERMLSLGAALSATLGGGTHWGEPSAAGKKIVEALKSPTELQFIETPLEDIIATFKGFHEIEIQIDQRALDDVGIPVDAPITKDLKGISLRSALRLMLGDLDLTYTIEDEVLLITTREESEKRMCVRVYPVGDLVGRNGESSGEEAGCESLMATFTTCIAPESWEGVGGPGSIAAFPPGKPSALVVRQSQRAHEEIADFFGNLRRAAEAKARGEIRPIGGSPLTAGAEKRIVEALESPTTMEFIETPLADVIEFLENEHRIEIQIDQRALDDVGIPSDTAVTIDVKGVSLRSALRLILRELDLTYMFRDEVLLITTPEEAEMVLVTKIYPLDHLVAGRREAAQSDRSYHDGLVKTITSMIAPQTWANVGGPGELTVLRLGALEALVVIQTRDVQDDVEGFWSRPEFREQESPKSDSPEPADSRRRQRSRRESRR